MSEKKPFRDCVEDALHEYSRWIEENSSKLADVFSDGCREFELSFNWISGDELESLPYINVSAEKIDKGIIDAIYDLN